METIGLKIKITRGESFTMDFSVTDKTGIPYIVLDKIPNPYLAITIASNKYYAEDNYRKTWWLDLTSLPKFSSVEPKQVVSTLNVGENDTDTEKYLYVVPTGKYYYLVNNEAKEYNFRILKSFSSQITTEWIEKEYTYDIKLLGGQTVKDYIQGVVRANELIPAESSIPDDLQELLNLFVGHEELLEGVHLDGRPLQVIDINQDILRPTEIYVLSDRERS